MVDIMLHTHQYVPSKSITRQTIVSPTGESVAVTEVNMYNLLFGGDQLTVARARGAKKTRQNSTSLDKRLDGLLPCIEDWHTKVVLLKV